MIITNDYDNNDHYNNNKNNNINDNIKRKVNDQVLRLTTRPFNITELLH